MKAVSAGRTKLMQQPVSVQGVCQKGLLQLSITAALQALHNNCQLLPQHLKQSDWHLT
jgi:hypothetical protein